MVNTQHMKGTAVAQSS